MKLLNEFFGHLNELLDELTRTFVKTLGTKKIIFLITDRIDLILLLLEWSPGSIVKNIKKILWTIPSALIATPLFWGPPWMEVKKVGV